MDHANIHDLIDECQKTLPEGIYFHDFTEDHSSAPVQAEELDGNWLTSNYIELRNASGKSSRIEIFHFDPKSKNGRSKDLIVRKDHFFESIDKAIQELN